MIPDKEFNMVFDLVVDDNPGGEILVQLLDRQNMRWGVRRGSGYTEETHTHGHILTIERGSGTLRVGPDELRYRPGQAFDIPKGVAHCIVQADEPTLVHQRNY